MRNLQQCIIGLVIYPGMTTVKIAQLSIKYEPASPFDIGSLEKTRPELVQKALSFIAEQMGLAIYAST